MKNAALASVPKHIEHFSKFSPSPLSMKQFLDFGEYRSVFRWTIFDVNAGGAGAIDLPRYQCGAIHSQQISCKLQTGMQSHVLPRRRLACSCQVLTAQRVASDQAAHIQTGPVQTCALLLPLVSELARFLFSSFQPPCRFDIRCMLFVWNAYIIYPCWKTTASVPVYMGKIPHINHL